jgi:hypothetical protein
MALNRTDYPPDLDFDRRRVRQTIWQDKAIGELLALSTLSKILCINHLHCRDMNIGGCVERSIGNEGTLLGRKHGKIPGLP